MTINTSAYTSPLAGIDKLDLPIPLERFAAVLQGAAVEAIRAFNSKKYAAFKKEDGSYLTTVDLAVHNYLVRQLPFIDDVLVVSEEGKDDPAKRLSKNKIWMIDPIDNTAGLIDGSLDNSSINISLIVDGKPFVGMIHYFKSNQSYMSVDGIGALKLLGITPSPHHVELATEPYRYVCYRSSLEQMCEQTRDYHQKLGIQDSQIVHLNRLPKRLKAIMDGLADVYIEPRPIPEWDVVAAISFVQALGGRCLDLNTGQDVRFNNESLRLPSFVLIRPGVDADKLMNSLKK
jgi:3'-phosphoadenosine 5'-phosphosulfate (PAPS) 3'-phosphatase